VTQVRHWFVGAMLYASLACYTTAAGAPSHAVTFDVERRGTICVHAPGARGLTAACSKRYGATQQDRALRHALRGADETVGMLHYADDGRTYLVFLVRVPSNAAHRTGYCGAGYEDSLVAARIHGDKLRLTDRLLVQSCLQSFTLEGGQPDNIMQAIAVDGGRRQITMRRESAPQDTLIHLESGTFKEATTPP